MKDDPQYHDGSGVIVWVLIALVIFLLLTCSWYSGYWTGEDKQQNIMEGLFRDYKNAMRKRVVDNDKNLVEEIKTSREREDLLLQEVKLLDYQVSVISNQVLSKEERP